MAGDWKRRAEELSTAKIEALAREEAARTGFDIDREPNGLFRMMMVVMSKPDVLKNAMIEAAKIAELEALAREALAGR